MKSWAEFQEEYRTPKFSRHDMNMAVEAAIKSCVVNRVIQKKDTGDIALQILAIHDYPGIGRTVIVK